MADLEIFRARTAKINIYVTQSGVAYSLASCKLWLTAKPSFADLDSVATFQLSSPSGGIVITDEDAGQAQATIANTDTSGLAENIKKVLEYDIQLKTATGEIYTIESGKLTVKPSVTRATT